MKRWQKPFTLISMSEMVKGSRTHLFCLFVQIFIPQSCPLHGVEEICTDIATPLVVQD